MTKYNCLKAGLIVSAALLALSACSKSPSGESSVTDEELASAIDNINAAMEMAKASKGSGQPAMWKLADEDTTVYLFGTVHLLRDGLDWRTSEFDTAFNASDTLYLEVDGTSPDALQVMQKLIGERAVFSDGETLSSVLNEADRAVVSAAADKVGLSLAGLEQAKPWFAGLQIGMTQIVKSGYNPMAGVEMVLTQSAQERGMDFRFLETPGEQIDVLSGAPMDEQIEGLVFTAHTIDAGTEMLDTLVDEWADGDVNGLGAMLGTPEMFGSKDAYDALITNRNKNWVPQIEAILDEPGSKFVAVGAGHLAGPDSVVKMLRDKGHAVTLVE